MSGGVMYTEPDVACIRIGGYCAIKGAQLRMFQSSAAL